MSKSLRKSGAGASVKRMVGQPILTGGSLRKIYNRDHMRCLGEEAGLELQAVFARLTEKQKSELVELRRKIGNYDKMANDQAHA